MKRLVLAVLLASRVASAEESLDDAVARAARADKPLIVELSAQWCGPCRVFEREVLSRAEVRGLLESVVFVRYDVDAPVGEAIAGTFNAVGVPTFIVLDAKGKELARHVGLGPAGSDPAIWFIDLVRDAHHKRATTMTLEHEVAVHGDDARARLALAKQYRALRRDEDARAQLELAAMDRDRAAAADAVAELDEIELADARVQEALDKALEFVTRFPDSPRASQGLVLLALSRHVGRIALNKIVEKHLQTVRPADLGGAVRVAILTSNISLGRHQLLERARAVPAGDLAVLRAELDLYANERRIAVRSVADACDAPGHDVACYLLEQAVATSSRLTAATTRMVRDATRQLDALDRLQTSPDDRGGIERLLDIAPPFRDALAKALRAATRECAQSARADRIAIVELRFRGGRARSRVASFVPELSDCVTDVLDAAELPLAPPELGAELELPLYFVPPASRDQATAAVPLVTHRGMSLTYAARVGDVDSQGIDLEGQVDVSGDREIRQLFAGEVEAGASGSGSMYAARAYFGLGIAISPRLAITLAGGIGTSQFTGQLSRGLEVPFEARLRVLRGRSRFQIWLRPVQLFGAADRKSQGDSIVFGADEYNIGAGLSTVLQGRRLFMGASYENRVAGKSGMFTVGVPFGVY